MVPILHGVTKRPINLSNWEVFYCIIYKLYIFLLKYMRLLQLNTQLSWHDDKLEDFLSREQFDVLTLQEVSRRTLERFSNIFDGYFERNFCLQWEQYWVALLVRKGLELFDKSFHQYFGGDWMTQNSHVWTEYSDYYSRGRFWVLSAKVQGDKGEIFIWTNYFPVAYPAHETNDDQREAMAQLLPLLEDFQNIAVTGDFNIARSNNKNDIVHPLYSTLWVVLRDKIPPHVVNTLDPKLHRVQGLEVVCDYIWSRWNHRVSNVRLHEGLSDHQGISADICVED